MYERDEGVQDRRGVGGIGRKTRGGRPLWGDRYLSYFGIVVTFMKVRNQLAFKNHINNDN